MAALTASRSTVRVGPETTATPPTHSIPLKANAKVFKGGLVCIDTATGYGVAGSTATTLIAVGIALKDADNTGGANGALSVDVLSGEFIMNNSGGDLVVQGDMYLKVYITDDNTVCHTSTGKSVAGLFVGFDATSGNPIVRIGNLSQTGV